MTRRSVVEHTLGVVLLAASAGWLYLDIRPDGHVDLTTASGCAVLAFAGGYFTDRVTTQALVSALVAAVRDVFSATKAGSDSTK